jgi:lipoprotein-releasing system permease protein
MRFELFLAARYLRAKRRQAVIGVVTGISIAGVAAGVAALIIALAITNGMKHQLQDRLLGNSASVQLMRVEKDGIRNWQPLIEKLRQVPHVVAASPILYEQVMVAHGARDGGAMVEGVLPDQEKTVSDLLHSATPGAVEALQPLSKQETAQQTGSCHAAVSKLPPIVLGQDLAENVGAACIPRWCASGLRGRSTRASTSSTDSWPLYGSRTHRCFIASPICCQ